MSSRVTPSVSIRRGNAKSVQLWLLWAGIIAPILFATIFTIDGLFKPGYSAADEAISYLEVGTNGWIQQANFILFGLLLLAFLVGYARQMQPILGRGWLYAGSLFLFLSDLGWITAGLFIPNPYLAPQFVWPAILHQIAFNAVFLPLTIGWIILGIKCIFTRRWRIYGVYSLIIGLPLVAFSIISIVHIINPALVADIVGNTNPQYDGVTNRIILFVAPIAWYVITAVLVLLRTDRAKGQV